MLLSLGEYGVYADDSGNDQLSHDFVLASLIALVDNWKAFSDEWWKVLISPKALKKGRKGKIYYKAYEADHRINCFDGFTPEESAQKTDELAGVILPFLTYGFSCSVRRDSFGSIVKARGPTTRKGKTYRYFRDPYFLLFRDLMSRVLGYQFTHGQPGQRIDFTFDRHGSVGRRCNAIFNDTQYRLRPELARIIGKIVPGDDAEDLLLQASDLVASKARKLLADSTTEIGENVRGLVRSPIMLHHSFTDSELESYIAGINVEFGVRRLSEAKMGRA